MVADGSLLQRVGRLFNASLSDFKPLRRDEAERSVEIGSHRIKVVEVRGGAGQLHVVNAASLPTPPSAIQNNMVNDTTAVAEATRALAESHGMRATKVVTAIPGPAVIIKRVTLPAQSA